MFARQKPRAAHPAPCRPRVWLKWQDVANHLAEALEKNFGEAVSLVLIVEIGTEGIHIGGKLPFAPHVVPGIFVSRHNVLLFHAQDLCKIRDETVRFSAAVAVIPS